MKLLKLFLLFLLSISASAQIQVGSDIDGEAPGDWSGYSVSLSSDGSIMAIGAPQNDGNGTFAGHVRIYKNISGTWTQVGADIDGEAANDWSGVSSSLSSDGSIVAIGASGNDGNGSDAGHVRIFKNINGTWTQVGSDIDGESAGDASGSSVSLSSDGSTVAIGARHNDGNGSSAGHVRIYENINSTWTQVGGDIDGEAAGDLSGSSVSLSGDGSTVAIGAHWNDGSGSEAGHVRVYKNINGTWTQVGSDIDGVSAVDYFGYSVSLSSDGSTVAIGATGDDSNGSNAGHVRIYKNISGTWTQVGADIDGEAAYDYSGESVSLSSDGSTVAIGAYGDDGNGSLAGHVRIYKNTNGTWTQVGADIDGEAGGDYSGASVSLSSDGSTVAIGARSNDGNGTNAGHVRVYNICPPTFSIDTITSCGPYTWIDGVTYTTSNYTASDTLLSATGCDSIVMLHLSILGTRTQVGADIDGEAPGDESGRSVSLSSDGSTMAIGAFSNDGNGTDAGHVRIYKNTNGSWTQVGADIDGEAAGDYSGYSVSLSSDGNTVAIGALYNDGNGSNAGHVRIYNYVNGTWTQVGADIDGEAANDGSGVSVSLSSDGSTVAIGAEGNDGNGSNAGHVRIYKNISGSWTQIGADIDGEAAGDYSGKSISLSSDGSTVAIGAHYNDGNGADAGHVRIYKNISGTWTQVGADIDGEAADDRSGESVSLSSDGSTVAIGAWNNDGNGSGSGHVRIYNNVNGTWTQVGADIDGEATADYSGYSVALSSDASTVAIGAYANNGNGTDAGHVRIYKNTNGTWTQVDTDIDGEAAYDWSGWSVSLNNDGSTVAIGARRNDGNGTNAGHVRVYNLESVTYSTDTITSCGPYTWIDGVTYSTSNYTATDTLLSAAGCDSVIVTLHLSILGTWTQVGADIDGEAAGDGLGESVSLSSDGSTMAIGANGNDGNGTDAGHVRIYKNTNGSWTQVGADIDGEAAGDASGSSVSLSSDGSTVAIGAWNNDGNGTSAGHVRIFENTNGTWTQVGADIDGEAAGDYSGISVSLSSDGNTVAIGAWNNAGNGYQSGHVRVYKNISGTWTQVGGDIDGEAAGDLSGSSVSLSGDGSTVAIGAHWNDGSGSDAGHVRVYKNINGTWTQVGSDIDGEAADDRSGVSVSLSSDGSTVAIGAPYNSGNGTYAGHARIYKNISGTWTQVGADIDGEASFDYSGYSVSLSGDGSTVAIGAYANNGNGFAAGHVRIYKNISGTWTQVDTDIDGEAAYDWSGWSVSLNNDGSTVAIGAYYNDGNGTDAGHVRVYNIESSVTYATDTITSCGPYTWIDGNTYTSSNNTATHTLTNAAGCDSVIVTLHLTIPNALTGNWTQVGADIDGEAAGDRFGSSVSLSTDGSTMAIGAWNNDGNGSGSGHVRIYNNVNGTWTQVGADIDGEAAGDRSGYSVSISSDGNTLAIGALRNDGNGTDAGHVRIYKNISGSWTQVGSDIDGEAQGDLSGYSVSLSSDGSTVAIGARKNDGNGTRAGHVRIYKNINGSWTQVGSDIDGEAAYDYSGESVSLSSDGNTVAIGAFENDGNGSDAGHVRIYKNISGSWTQVGSDIDGEAAGDNSGRSVSLSSDGSTVAIGAPVPNVFLLGTGNVGNGSYVGYVRVYKNISGTWTQVGADIDGEAAGDYSGYSVSLSSDGSTVAFGAWSNDGNGVQAGHVRIYKNISGTWTQVGSDIDGEAASDLSGWSVSLSGDGSTVAIGAPQNDGNETDAGHVRVYNIESSLVHTTDTITSCGPYTWIDGVTYSTSNYTATDTLLSAAGCDSIVTLHLTIPNALTGNWTQIGSDIDGEAAYDSSGRSVSLSSDGSTVAIGAIYNDGNGTSAGHVRIYKNISGTWTQVGADIDGEAQGDLSGYSVSLSSDGSTVAIGAIYNDGNGTSAGHVRIYKNISGTWTQVGADIDGEAAGDRSGASVSLNSDGSTVAIGAHLNDGNGLSSGHVRIYRNISGTWTQIGSDIDGEAAYDSSGRSVSLSSDGNTVAIGAPYNGGNGFISGHVRVYNNVNGTWTQVGADIDGEAISERSGISVSLSSNGNTVAIGEWKDGIGSGSGPVRVYNNVNGTWTQVGTDIDGAISDSLFGVRVSLSSDGGTVAIGAAGNDDIGAEADAGHVRIYKNISGTWTQVGTDIDGEAAYDWSGYSVSLSSDGSTVAIGAPHNNGNGFFSGHVRVYNLESVTYSTDTITSCGPYTWIDGVTYTTSNYTATDTLISATGCDSIVTLHLTIPSALTGNWTQVGSDIDGEAAGDRSGYSVSISSDGNTLAIGALRNDGNGTDAGHVRIYKNISGSWTQVGSDIDGEAAGDYSGYSVSLSSDGSVVAIGAYWNDGNGAYAGHVRIYKNISGTWTQVGADIDGEAAGDWSGASVSLSSDGSTVAIGARLNDGNGSQSGHVRIYRNISGTWAQVGADIDGEVSGDWSGASVSLSSDGNTVAIGAPYNDGNGSTSGHVRIYKNISGTWTQVGADIDGEAIYDQSGQSVSLSSDGSTVAIGAPWNGGYGFGGHVRIYKNIIGAWTQVGTDIDGAISDSLSGVRVSLSSDGSTVAIGANGHDSNGSNAGHVRVYRNISGAWTQVGADINGEAAYDWSGYSVSLSSDGSTVAIGAPQNDGNGSNAGHVRVYNLESVTYSTDTITSCGPYTWIDGVTYTTSNYTATDTLISATGCDSIVTLHLTIPSALTGNWTQVGSDIDGEAAGDRSGYSVSISSDGNTLAIGALRNDGNGTDAGHVRIYKNISGSWTQVGSDIDGEAAGDYSGYSVSLSSDGSVVAIGAYWNDGNGAYAGHVRIYKNISGTWTQVGADIDGEAAGDWSGASVSLSSDGSTVAIGARLNDGNGSQSGHVRIYRNISGTWAQVGADIDGEAAGDGSGFSVSLSSDGNTVAIGAPSNDGNGSTSGHVRIYKNISGTWTQVGADIDGEAIYDQSGQSVSLSSDGSTVAIGAPWNGGYGFGGHVRIYKNIIGAWTQVGADIDGAISDSLSGVRVSLSSDGSTVAIGANGHDSNGSNAGHVRVYRNISGAWTQVGADINGEAAYDWSGYSVSLSSDGSTVAIGAPQNDGNGSNAGHVRVYNLESVTYSTDTITSCGPYTWIDGVTYTTSNYSATYTLTNADGCDSVVTLDLDY
jgi:Flp pilus assembly pilin Flp